MRYQFNGKNYEKVVVWGGGRALPKYEYVMEYVDYIVDKDPALIGGSAFGVDIYSPEAIGNETGNILVAVTTFIYLNEIEKMCNEINSRADVKFIADVFQNKMIYFGQYREDAIVEILLRKHTREKIRYLEIGVPDPINGSNTYHFYLNGHSGVCIEANPDVIENVKQKRPNDEVLCCGCGAAKDEGSDLKFYVIKGRGSANTFSEKSLKILMEKGFQCEKIIKIPIISLNTVIYKYFANGVDYVSIDVEGYEYIILSDFDFKKYSVGIFCIEKGDERVYRLMMENSYLKVAETPSNWIFMKKEWAKEHKLLLEK